MNRERSGDFPLGNSGRGPIRQRTSRAAGTGANVAPRMAAASWSPGARRWARAQTAGTALRQQVRQSACGRSRDAEVRAPRAPLRPTRSAPQRIPRVSRSARAPSLDRGTVEVGHATSSRATAGLLWRAPRRRLRVAVAGIVAGRGDRYGQRGRRWCGDMYDATEQLQRRCAEPRPPSGSWSRALRTLRRPLRCIRASCTAEPTRRCPRDGRAFLLEA